MAERTIETKLIQSIFHLTPLREEVLKLSLRVSQNKCFEIKDFDFLSAQRSNDHAERNEFDIFGRKVDKITDDCKVITEKDKAIKLFLESKGSQLLKDGEVERFSKNYDSLLEYVNQMPDPDTRLKVFDRLFKRILGSSLFCGIITKKDLDEIVPLSIKGETEIIKASYGTCSKRVLDFLRDEKGSKSVLNSILKDGKLRAEFDFISPGMIKDLLEGKFRINKSVIRTLRRGLNRREPVFDALKRFLLLLEGAGATDSMLSKEQSTIQKNLIDFFDKVLEPFDDDEENFSRNVEGVVPHHVYSIEQKLK